MPYNQTNFNKIALTDNVNSELNIIVTVYLYFHYMRGLLNRVPCVPACQSGLRANVLSHQRALRANVFAYPRGLRVNMPKRANFLFLRPNIPINVPKCHKACQCFNLRCQHDKQFFKHSSYEILREISILYYYIKTSTLYFIDIIVIHIICICIYHT